MLLLGLALPLATGASPPGFYVEVLLGGLMDISDRVVVLDYGKKIGDGTPDAIRGNQAVIDAYLGVAH
jgi:branched-chain amino acid transport system ATP-binding protein